MTRIIVSKAKRILYGIEYGYFDTAKNWNKDNYDEYYLYFSHPIFEVRSYSLCIFTAGLGNWYMESAFIFRNQDGLKNRNNLKDANVYYFEDYVQAFLNNNEKIKKEFPNLYRLILFYLRGLYKRKQLEDFFQSGEQRTINELRIVLEHSYEEDLFVYENFDEVLRELKLTK